MIELLALLLIIAGAVLLDVYFFSAPAEQVQITVEQMTFTDALLEGGDGVSEGSMEAVQTSTASSNTGKVKKINLNTANAAELETLEGIGESRAAAIVTYREEHGAFQSIDELLEVPGIGEGTLEKVQDMVEVR